MPYRVDVLCDICSTLGAYDFMGDYYCEGCRDKHLYLTRPPEDTLPKGEIWYECIEDDIIQWEESGSAEDDYEGHGCIAAKVANSDATNWLVYFANLGLLAERTDGHVGGE